jgi:hypothetical protein
MSVVVVFDASECVECGRTDGGRTDGGQCIPIKRLRIS